MSPRDKPLAWLRGEVKYPAVQPRRPNRSRILASALQRGESIALPHSRPMPAIGARCHELRIVDREQAWRIVYHVARDAVVILEVFSKKTPATPASVITACRKRLEAFQTLSTKKKDVDAKRKT